MNIRINTGQAEGAIYPFWTIMNANMPHRFTQEEFITGIKRDKPYISQANAVYLLGGRRPKYNVWYKGQKADGTLDVDFTGMIEQLKGMLDNGYTPWPVLDNVPYAMSGTVANNAFGNTAPPADEELWQRYVEAALQAMVDAFGKEEVGTWWFRVGTEPDYYPGHWAGTREQYLDHYDHTVAALETVIPEAKIGPGNILNPREGEYGVIVEDQWGLDIIDHCAQNGTRLEWFSWSWYGMVGKSVNFFNEAVEMVKERLAPYPQYINLPLVIGEYMVLHDEDGKRLYHGDASEWAASFYAAVADRVYRYGLHHVYEWAQAEYGVYHPRTRVISMLDRMTGGERLPVTVQDAGPESGAIACSKADELYVLVYHHTAERGCDTVDKVSITITDPRLKADRACGITEQRVDRDHTVWVREFEKDCKEAGAVPRAEKGRYEPDLRMAWDEKGGEVYLQNIDTYRRLSEMPETDFTGSVRSADGACTLQLDLPAHSVRLLRITPGNV